MRIDIFKSKFSEADFDPKNTESAIEGFQDSIDSYIRDLQNVDCRIVGIDFKFFDDGRAIAVVKYEDYL